MSPAQAACDRLGSTSTMISAIQVKKNARMVQTAGLYPFLAATQAVSTMNPIQITSKNSASGSPMFGTKTSSPSAARPRGQTITRTRL
jgi:hypothetical protein